MSDDPTLRPLASSLASATVGGDDLVRFRPDVGDDQFSALVHGAELYDDVARRDLRTLLKSDATYNLHLFAKRRVALGQRTSNVSYFHQALSALSLLPTVDDIPWKTWFVAALLLGEYANDPDVVRLFEGASTAGGTICQSIQKSLRAGGSLAQCHLVEVETTYGKGMIELPVPVDVPSGGWLSAPLIEKDDATYAPTFNLAQMALDIADAIDGLANTRTSAIEYSPLAVAGAFISSSGCLRSFATSTTGSFDIYAADLKSESDAKTLVSQVTENGGAGASRATAVIVLLEQPSFDDDSVSSFDAESLKVLAERALPTR
ncbi:MAG: hypothetical protein WA359_10710 [Acidimicrobiales bacterium]